jgi:hypothetical protein
LAAVEYLRAWRRDEKIPFVQTLIPISTRPGALSCEATIFHDNALTSTPSIAVLLAYSTTGLICWETTDLDKLIDTPRASQTSRYFAATSASNI